MATEPDTDHNPHVSPSRWRSLVLDEAARLDQELRRVRDKEQESRDWKLAAQDVALARALVATRGGPSLRGLGALLWPRTKTYTSGAAWAALHRASEALLMVESPACVRADALELRAALAENPLSLGDPRQELYEHTLAEITDQGANGSEQEVSVSLRETLRAIRRTANARAEAAYAQLKDFRSLLIVFTVILTLAVAGIALLATIDASGFTTCGPSPAPGVTAAPCPHGSGADARDVWEVAALGALGGLATVIATLRRSRGFRGPFSLYTAQAVLKLPAGALSGLIGVLLLQRGVFGTLDAQPGERVFAYAIIFGVAQQAFTLFVDRRADEVLGVAQANTSLLRGQERPAPARQPLDARTSRAAAERAT